MEQKFSENSEKFKFYPKSTETGSHKNDPHSFSSRNYAAAYYQTLEELIMQQLFIKPWSIKLWAPGAEKNDKIGFQKIRIGSSIKKIAKTSDIKNLKNNP